MVCKCLPNLTELTKSNPRTPSKRCIEQPFTNINLYTIKNLIKIQKY